MTDPSKTPALDDDALREILAEEFFKGRYYNLYEAAKGERPEIEFPFDAVLAAMRRLSVSPPVPEGWRTIDSAPKDGTQIFGYYPVWKPENKTQTPDFLTPMLFRWNGIGWDTGHWMLHDTPTHWMPLLPPPAATQGQEG